MVVSCVRGARRERERETERETDKDKTENLKHVDMQSTGMPERYNDSSNVSVIFFTAIKVWRVNR